MYALILAGGKGERLRPLTDAVPKPMVPVGGRPILEHQVEWLKQAGVTDVVFLTGYLWETIQDHFGDGQRFGVRAHYSVEDAPLGRGGAIRQGLSMVPGSEQYVVAVNGDVITAQELVPVIGLHERLKRSNPSHMATIVVVPMISPYGIVELSETDQVVGFQEKVELPHWINAGIYILDRKVSEVLPELGDHETETFPGFAKTGKIAALRSRAFWRSVDSFKDLREVEEALVRRADLG